MSPTPTPARISIDRSPTGSAPTSFWTARPQATAARTVADPLHLFERNDLGAVGPVHGDLADDAEVAEHGGGDILERQFNRLPLAGAQAMALACEQGGHGHVAGDQVPGGQHVGDGLARGLRPGRVGKADRRVHGIVDGGAAHPVTQQRDHDEVGAVLAERFVVHPPAHAQVGEEEAGIVARGAYDLGDEFAAPRRLHVDCDRALLLVLDLRLLQLELAVLVLLDLDDLDLLGLRQGRPALANDLDVPPAVTQIDENETAQIAAAMIRPPNNRYILVKSNKKTNK